VGGAGFGSAADGILGGMAATISWGRMPIIVNTVV
jgi:hypothetical protein